MEDEDETGDGDDLSKLWLRGMLAVDAVELLYVMCVRVRGCLAVHGRTMETDPTTMLRMVTAKRPESLTRDQTGVWVMCTEGRPSTSVGHGSGNNVCPRCFFDGQNQCAKVNAKRQSNRGLNALTSASNKVEVPLKFVVQVRDAHVSLLTVPTPHVDDVSHHERRHGHE